MSKHIDAESKKLRELRQISDVDYVRLERYCGTEYANGYADGWMNAIGKVINNMPIADVEEVKHGKWVLVKPRRNGRNATYKCTVCNQLYSSYYNDVQEWIHCPCGARMCKEKEV